MEKEMATHSSVLAWRIPGRGSLVGCRLWGRTESDTTGPRVRFLRRYDGEVSEPLVGRQGSRVSMRVARGSASLLLLPAERAEMVLG